MDECIFCQIAAGSIPSHTVHEGAEVLAFLDVNPLAPGHTLVVPRAHHERLQSTSAATMESLWSTVHELIPAIEDAVGADATTIGVNNGRAAGQEVQHVHVHIVPRFDGDGGRPIHAVGGEPPSLDDDELETICTDITENL